MPFLLAVLKIFYRKGGPTAFVHADGLSTLWVPIYAAGFSARLWVFIHVLGSLTPCQFFVHAPGSPALWVFHPFCRFWFHACGNTDLFPLFSPSYFLVCFFLPQVGRFSFKCCIFLYTGGLGCAMRLNEILQAEYLEREEKTKTRVCRDQGTLAL